MLVRIPTKAHVEPVLPIRPGECATSARDQVTGPCRAVGEHLDAAVCHENGHLGGLEPARALMRRQYHAVLDDHVVGKTKFDARPDDPPAGWQPTRPVVQILESGGTKMKPRNT